MKTPAPPLKACFILGLLLSSNAPLWASQNLAAQAPTRFIDPDTTLGIPWQYTVSQPETGQEAGLGLRVHFDTRALELGIDTLFSNGLQPLSGPWPDSEDADHDPRTDQYYLLSWLDLEAGWPGTAQLPLPLLQLQLRTIGNFSGHTRINLSAAATARNTSLYAPPLTLCRKPELSLITLSQVATEGGPAGLLRISSNTVLPESCGDLRISLQAGGTATPDQDYPGLPDSITLPAGSQFTDVAITALADNETETDESLTLALLPGNDYTLTASTSVTLQLRDAGQPALPTQVSISSSRSTLDEAQAGTVLLTLTRTQGDWSVPLTVQLQPGGTATAGQDYQLDSLAVTFEANNQTAFAALIIRDDDQLESDETLQLSIVADDGYQPGPVPQVSLLIRDDDRAAGLRNTDQLPARSLSQADALQTGAETAETEPAASADATTADPLPGKVSEVSAIPTLQEWLLGLLGLLLGLLALPALSTRYRVSISPASRGGPP
ncbi:MAG TPA: Calx-beta domain-containing protein [Thiolinea sp.]|nr:Calx-beta domain-containing protein [Thiolinea sp.]